MLADAHTADRIAMALKTYDSYAPATYSTVASTWRTQARRMTTNFSTRLGYTGLTISSVAFSANVANGRYGAAAVNVADFGMGYLGMSGNSRAMAVSFVYFASRFAFDDGG